MKIQVFRDVMPCRFVIICGRFEEPFSFIFTQYKKNYYEDENIALVRNFDNHFRGYTS